MSWFFFEVFAIAVVALWITGIRDLSKFEVSDEVPETPEEVRDDQDKA